MKGTGKIAKMSLVFLFISALALPSEVFSWVLKVDFNNNRYQRRHGYSGAHGNNKHRSKQNHSRHRYKNNRLHGKQKPQFRQLKRHKRHFRFSPRQNHRPRHRYGGDYYRLKHFPRGNYFSFSFMIYSEDPYPSGVHKESTETYRQLRLYVQPTEAEVFLDGKYVGTAEDLNEITISVRPGQHKIKLIDGPYSSYFGFYVTAKLY